MFELQIESERMRKTTAALIGVGALLALAGVTTAHAASNELPTVAKVDLKRYLGKWYEISKYPAWFEKDCDRDTTAEYSLKEDGDIEVVNSCTTKEGKRKVSKGTAKIVDSETNAKLKVTFFWPFYGKYWIIDLDPNYQWVVVGEPSRKYLWVLSRTPKLDDKLYREIADRLPAKGYDPVKLVPMKQTSK